MRNYTIVGNWKMHMGPGEAGKFVQRLGKKVVQHTHVTSVLCPPFISIPEVSKLAEPDIFKIGAQNIYEQDEGAFTGEVSGPMLKNLAGYVIVGHSERRRNFYENDKQIANKVAAAIRNGLRPILCVGENLDERHDCHARRVVNDQLHGCLSQVTEEDLKDVLIAYEPVWAIGTGEFATPEQAGEMFKAIRTAVEEMFGEGASSKIQILYGGSANPDNCKAYLKLKHCNGLLVGGASINYEQFAAIIKTAQDLASN